MRFLLLLLIPLFSFAQEKKMTITYDFFDNFRHIETNAILICDNNHSTFKTLLEKFSSNLATADKGSNTINIGGKRIDIYQVIDKNNKTLLSYDIRENTIYEISEELPKLNWKIDYTDTKKINDYICNKATVSFRGRNYTSWYTLKLPFSFGPWKFTGLPGLILEISDDTKTFKWAARKIQYPSNKNLSVPYKGTKAVTLKELIDIQNENSKKLRARLRSIMPRGAVMNTPKNRRNGIELVYEWEE